MDMNTATYTDQIAITGETVYHKVAKLIDARAKLERVYMSGRRMGKTYLTEEYLKALGYNMHFLAEIGAKRVADQMQIPLAMAGVEVGRYDGVVFHEPGIPLIVDFKTQHRKPMSGKTKVAQMMMQQLQQ